MKQSLRKKAIKLCIFIIIGFFIALTFPSLNIKVSAQDVLPSTANLDTYIVYKVRSGNTLSLLAERFGTTVDRIKSLNGLTSDIIYINQALKIPAIYIEYVVKSGDYLIRIANNFNTSVEKIRLFNNLYTDMIYVGQVLYIPYVSTVPYVTYITHTVILGDNIWKISIKYGIPQYELLKVNGLTTSSILNLGQKLKIPVYTIPVTATPGPQFGEYLDWWTQAQYLFPIGRVVKVRDFLTGTTFNIKRTIGANHADCEPMTSADAAIMLKLWNNSYSWVTRSALIEEGGRKIASSITSMPHGEQYIIDNNFNGHFDIHFKNSTRHKDGLIDPSHQAKVKIAAGITP
jgi:LysM repeat protein